MTLSCSVLFLRTWRFAAPMAAASVTPPGSLDVLQPGFSKTLLGTKPEDKYLCSACRNVLRRPFQAQCGHRYCSYCLTSILRYWGPVAGGGFGLGSGRAPGDTPRRQRRTADRKVKLATEEEESRVAGAAWTQGVKRTPREPVCCHCSVGVRACQVGTRQLKISLGLHVACALEAHVPRSL